jgi:thiol-disulfide isomerase/thioredoxin
MTGARFTLLLTLLACCGHGAPPPSAPNEKLGQAVSFSLPSADGALVTVPLAGARATVLDFFGPTCEPCRKKLPPLYAQRDALAARGVKLVLIAVLGDGESSADAQRALAAWGVNAPFLVDSAGTGKSEAGVTALPATIVLDEHGVAKWVAPSGASADDVVRATD